MDQAVRSKDAMINPINGIMPAITSIHPPTPIPAPPIAREDALQAKPASAEVIKWDGFSTTPSHPIQPQTPAPAFFRIPSRVLDLPVAVPEIFLDRGPPITNWPYHADYAATCHHGTAYRFSMKPGSTSKLDCGCVVHFR